MTRNQGILTATTAALVIGVGGWMVTRQNGDNAIIYRTAVVERKDLRQTVSATGTVQPFKVVDIKSRAGGEIIRLAVEVGDRVKKGQLIARIDPTDSNTAFRQATADVSAADARIRQTEQTLTLQKLTAETGVAQAAASVRAAAANVRAAEVRLVQARKQSTAQPLLTEAAIRQARASLTAAEQNLRQLRSAGDPTARAEARTGLAAARATLVNAENNLRRQKQLLAKGFVAQAAVDTAQAQYDNARADVEAAATRAETVGVSQEAQIRVAEARVAEARETVANAETNRVNIELRRQDVRNAEAGLSQARAALAQAQANLRTAEANRLQVGIRAADIESARAQYERARAARENTRVVLDQTTIVSPRDGVVLQKYVEEGTIIASGSAFSSTDGQGIVQLGDLTKVYVDAAVDETDISSVRVGQPVKLTFDSLPDVNVEGTVQRIEPRGTTDQNITTIKTRIELKDPKEELRPGLNAECEFIVAEKKDVVVIPSRAVRTEKGKKFVQVMVGDEKQGGKPEQREIKVGMETSDAVEVLDGLKEGEKVVVATIEPGKGGQGRGA
ncbi:MAG: efflux RND transporter periplasmic adaptor subunit, partial [Capsulimonadales bacterium]|nr:efflux RND transporter periplasmic adaptor subunit [Capsulimonadales bacterium]